MALTLTLTDSAPATGTRRRTLSQQVRVGAVSLVFVVFTLALAVSLIYLAHANRTATRGYIIKRLEIEKEDIQTEKEIWEARISNARSLTTVKNSPTFEELRPVSGVNFVRLQLAEK